MYFNVFGEKVSRARYREMLNAAKNRRELIAAGLTSRRTLFKMGLLTAGGMLVTQGGLSARAQTNPPSSGSTNSPGTNQLCLPSNQTASPATRAFIEPLVVMPLARNVSHLSPAPTENPNTGAGEVRAAPFQAPQIDPVRFPVVPGTLYQFNQRQFTTRQSPDLPQQTIWGYDDGTGTRSPGPTYRAFYGSPQLTRNINSLPTVAQVNNTGFGLPSVTTHLHNGHTPSESDGNPCDFYGPGHFCDQYYPNVLAGFNSDHAPTGDINESLSTLWYHDHRENFTSQNVYKGLLGFFLLFNNSDTGDETTGFRLPSFPAYDIPMAFADRCFDAATGQMVFDTFNTDGILGDKFMVNGVIQPVLHVSPRRYRLRWLNTGPSRFLQVYITDLTNPSASQPFWQISNDGNLLPQPVQVPAVALGVAERADVIIDFRQYAGKTIYLENRLDQPNGQGGPTGSVVAGGQGFLMLKIIVDGPSVADNSVDPATLPSYYALPSVSASPLVTRSFNFDQTRDGQWTINGKLFSCNTVRFNVKQNSLEQWSFNGGFGWSHPIHVHLEEFQVTRGAPGLYGSSSDDHNNYSRWSSQYCWSGCSSNSSGVNLARKDVVRLIPRGNVTMKMRFRDWLGRYPLHCHNVIHEDHAMMLRFDVATTGDTNSNP